MDNKIIQEFIDKGQELELIDKMNSYVITEVDTRFLNVVKILIILQENSKLDWTQANRALVTLITKMLDKVFSGPGTVNLDALMHAIENNAPAPYQNTSYLGRQFIIGIEDNDAKFLDTGISQENLEVLKQRLQFLNTKLLQKAIEMREEYSIIINLLYNCVDHLGTERRIFLLHDALQIFGNYVRTYPNDYLKDFIRPFYYGTTKYFIDHYYHVPEPFYNQIFNNQFESFLENASIGFNSKSLISDIQSFHRAFKDESSSGQHRRVTLYSAEMEKAGIDKSANMLKLQSDEHNSVRQECLPPLYRSEEIIKKRETYGF